MEQVTVVPRIKARASDAHKGLFGKVLVIAGSLGMSGAASLVGRAALRAGSGLVRVAVPKGILPIVAGIEPCYTTIPLAEDESGIISDKAVNTVLDAVSDNDVIACGPGLRVGTGPCAVVENLIAQDGIKLVLDADGLITSAKSRD
jgi:NAD(P)H-hydrate epimerase